METKAGVVLVAMSVLFFTVASVSGATFDTVLISDNFDRADSADLGATAEGFTWKKSQVAAGSGNGTCIAGNKLTMGNVTGGGTYTAYLDAAGSMARDFEMTFDVKQAWTDVGGDGTQRLVGVRMTTFLTRTYDLGERAVELLVDGLDRGDVFGEQSTDLLEPEIIRGGTVAAVGADS
ncbi:MAG: hypothetical protein GXY38_14605 [Planctomycetes bacterium]|nr:hypothetical protein [Planctomycetota bacterium]